MRYYAGIGSRETPENVCHSMTWLARYLAKRGWHLRTGGAKGADQAFERGAPHVMPTPGGFSQGARLPDSPGERRHLVYLPWFGYNQYFDDDRSNVNAGDWHWARPIAEKYYGKRWKWTTDVVKRFMTRNVAIVLGGDAVSAGVRVDNGPPEGASEFVVCWTPDGKVQGGTAQAIKVAAGYGIPVFNLAIYADLENLWQKIKD